MRRPIAPETWLPDPIERCQDGLRRSWEANPQGDCWFMTRSALERFFQEDKAGTDLPDPWRKLLAVSNLPADALSDLPAWLRFSAQDFEILTRWSKELGDKLDLIPETAFPELAAASPKIASPDIDPKPSAPNLPKRQIALTNYAFLAASILIPILATYAYTNGLVAGESAKRQSAERRAETAVTNLKVKDAELNEANQSRQSILAKAATLANTNAALQAKIDRQAQADHDKSLVPPIQELPGIDLKPLTLARTAGRSSGWDQRSPSFTVLRQSPTSFTWEKGKSIPATVQVIDQTTQKRVWSHATTLAEGKIADLPPLQPGHAYLWSVVTDSEDEGYSGIPFYILSGQEKGRLAKALTTAPDDAARAALTAKFGLFDELGPTGLQAKRRRALR